MKFLFKIFVLSMLFQIPFLMSEETEILKKFSTDEKQVLERFFRSLFISEMGGYTIYGQKPLTSDSFVLPEENFGEGDQYAYLYLGAKIWQTCQQTNVNDHCLILSCDQIDRSGIHIINLQSFNQTFQKNKPLFQQSLGPWITCKSLIQEFYKKPKFTQVLQGDAALEGILLGFGTENALYGKRHEILACASCVENLCPCYGFASVKEEINTFSAVRKPSSKKLDCYVPRLTFGVFSQDSETKELIANYEATQLKLIKLLSSDTFLQEVITKIKGKNFTRTTSPRSLFTFDANEQMLLPQLVAMSIWNQLKTQSSAYQEAFLEGMRLADTSTSCDDHKSEVNSPDRAKKQGHLTWSFYKQNKDYFTLAKLHSLIDAFRTNALQPLELSTPIYRDLLARLQWMLYTRVEENESNEAITFLHHLEKEQAIRCLIKDRLYYQPLEKGSGTPCTSNDIISISYCICNKNDEILREVDKATPVELDLKRTVEGFKQGLVGLKPGAKGILYIHPDLGDKDAYRGLPYTLLIAEIELSSQNSRN